MTTYTVSGSGQTSSHITLSSGDTMTVESGGRAAHITVNSGGSLTVDSGGATRHTIVNSSGTEAINGGAGYETRVDSGGTQDLASGGLGEGAKVYSGGTQNVNSGGIADDATVNVGGVDNVNSGGLDKFTYVNGGTENVNGGTAEFTTVGGGSVYTHMSPGWPFVGDQRSEDGSSTTSGVENVMSGGVATGTRVDVGGVLIVDSGGTISGAKIDGGEIELQSGSVVGSSTIRFEDGGTLKIDGTGSFDFLVAGFGKSPYPFFNPFFNAGGSASDALDLSAVNFASATESYSGNSSSGTLMVTDGTNSVSLLLLGNYTAASFQLEPESGGGTGTVVTEAAANTESDNFSRFFAPHHG